MEKEEFIQRVETERTKFDIVVKKLQENNDLLTKFIKLKIKLITF